jgi:hypothetical protein
MKPDLNPEQLASLLEELAAIEHERWSHWQRYMHGKGMLQQDGSLVLPSELVAQWQKQMDTPYGRLTEQEKESDREQVRKYFPTVVKALTETQT